MPSPEKTPHIWEMRVVGLAIDPLTGAPVVVLRDVDEKHQVPIWVGQAEAVAIASELEGFGHGRPMTHDLLKNVFDELGAKILRVEINDLRDDTFYAKIYASVGSREIAIDSRPSDAIALALRADVPLFAHDHVVQQARMDPPPDPSEVVEESTQLTKEERIAHIMFQGPDARSDEEWEEFLQELGPNAFGKYKQ